MPVIPSTYQTNTPITAHQLNQDLYTYDGTYFGANGVMFHSNRPLLVSSYITASNITAAKGGSFTILGGTDGNAISIVDNAGLFGVGSDGPGDAAMFQSTGAIAPGSSGYAGYAGGWNLICSFVPLGSFSGTSNTYGVLWFFGQFLQKPNEPLQDIGCMQPGATGHNNCGFALDLVERQPNDPGVYAVGVFATDPNGTTNHVVANTSGTTGQTPRYSEIWAGVVNGASLTVSTIPSPLTAITTTSTITSATLNTSIGQTFNLLNSPPILNCGVQSTTSISANAVTTVPFTVTPFVDNYSGFSTASSTYTVKLPGIYLCHANVIYKTSWNSGAGVAGFQVSGTNYWGGSYSATPNGNQNTGISVTKVLDLNAGDTVKVVTETSSSSGFGTANISHFIMLWLTPIDTTQQSWTPPEVTGFQFLAGTPPGSGSGQLANIMNTKIANDINFLLHRPYLTVHQTTAQTSLTANAFTSVTMQSTVGLVHGSLGDNYHGWSSANNWYVAPVSGWYLAVSEVNAGTTTSSGNVLTAAFSLPTSGGLTAPTSPDSYQAILAPTSWTFPTGATALNVYYLSAGEHISPAAMFTTSWATDVTHNFLSHFNVIWMSN